MYFPPQKQEHENVIRKHKIIHATNGHPALLCSSLPVQWPSHPTNKTCIKKSGEVASIVIRIMSRKPPRRIPIPFHSSPFPFPHLHRRSLHHLRPLEHFHLRLHQTQRTLLLPIRIIVRLHRRVAFQVNQRPVLKCQPALPHTCFVMSCSLPRTHPFVNPIVRSRTGPSGANDATRNQDVWRASLGP
jgi:hypothetical protein